MRDALAEHSRGTLQQFKSWSPLGGCVAIIIFAVVQWNAYTVFRVHTEDLLASVQGRLLTLEAPQAPKKVFQELGALPPKQLAQALPALRTIAEQRISAVDPPKNTLLEIASRLQKVDETSPDYWPATLRFIQFASSAISPSAPPSGPPTMVLERVSSNIPLRKLFPSPIMEKVVFLSGVEISGGTFENCRIVFGLEPSKMKDIVFINCVFDFPSGLTTPPSHLQIAAKEILNGKISNVIMNYPA